jgi:hypothetical protein
MIDVKINGKIDRNIFCIKLALINFEDVSKKTIEIKPNK